MDNNAKNYAIVLASGKGTRINDNLDLPKQFRKIGNIPVIIRTLKNIIQSEKFNYIYVVVSEEYKEYTKNLIKEYFLKHDNIIIVCGGKERIDSIQNAVKSIQQNNEINNEDIVLIHDSVRPFITNKIINDSIEGAKTYGAVVCAAPVSDTLLKSENGNLVNEIPDRSIYYKGQAPDTFKLNLFIELLNKIPLNKRHLITGTSIICTMNNYPIHLVDGDDINFKITSKSDLIIAENIARESDDNNEQ